jgi:bifunctional ADP-heptose synthase (sugar kinase/adenylyltransferase)
MKHIAVIGEVCTDEYIFGQCDRVCPEAPSLCFNHNNKKHTNVGMAGNVYSNLVSLNNNSYLFNIDLIAPVSDIIKRRFVDTRYNSVVFREDINDSVSKIDLHKYVFNQYDCIVFADYCKGFLLESDIQYICEQKKNTCITFLDTKKQLKSLAPYINFIKINHLEYKNNMQYLDIITEYAKLIVTYGEEGAKAFTKTDVKHYPSKKVILRDVCGAGDTFLAALVFNYLDTNNIDMAINFANTCASKVVSQVGVATI